MHFILYEIKKYLTFETSFCWWVPWYMTCFFYVLIWIRLFTYSSGYGCGHYDLIFLGHQVSVSNHISHFFKTVLVILTKTLANSCGSSAELTARCIGPNSMAEVHIGDNRNGTYSLLICPSEPGRHTLEVKYGEDHIQGRSGCQASSSIPWCTSGLNKKIQTLIAYQTCNFSLDQLFSLYFGLPL